MNPFFKENFNGFISMLIQIKFPLSIQLMIRYKNVMLLFTGYLSVSGWIHRDTHYNNHY